MVVEWQKSSIRVALGIQHGVNHQWVPAATRSLEELRGATKRHHEGRDTRSYKTPPGRTTGAPSSGTAVATRKP